MLHATIHTARGAFHFIGEVNGYNLQTLHQHVIDSTKAWGPVRLSIELEDVDTGAFAELARRWLPSLRRANAVVEVREGPDGDLVSAGQVRRPLRR